MKLYIYKSLPDDLTDCEKVTAFLLTTMFKHERSEHMRLTINRYDLLRVLHGGQKSKIVDMHQLNFESGLGKVFVFGDYGDRIAIRIRPEILATKYNCKKNMNMTVKRVSISELRAQKVAIYLHAVLNHIDSWFIDEPFDIFNGDRTLKTRFAPEGANFYTTHEMFRAENIFGD